MNLSQTEKAIISKGAGAVRAYIKKLEKKAVVAEKLAKEARLKMEEAARKFNIHIRLKILGTDYPEYPDMTIEEEKRMKAAQRGSGRKSRVRRRRRRRRTRRRRQRKKKFFPVY